MDVRQQHNPDVFFIDLVEPEELRDHMLSVKQDREQAFFTATSTSGICKHRELQDEQHVLQSSIKTCY